MWRPDLRRVIAGLVTAGAIGAAACSGAAGGSGRGRPTIAPADPAQPDDASFYVPPHALDEEVRLPPVSSDKLANGIAVHVAPRSEVPMVTIRFVLRWNEAGPVGAKLVLTSLLFEPAEGPQGLPHLLSDLGAFTSWVVDHDTMRVEVDVLPDGMDAAIAAVVSALRRTKADAASYKHAIEEAKRTDAAESAEAKQLWRLVWGSSHPYAGYHTGSAKALDALKPQEVEALSQRAIRPDALQVVVAGATTLAAVKASVERATKGWIAPGAAPKPAAITGPAPGVVLVAGRGGARDHAVVAFPLPPTPSQDDLAIEMTLGTVESVLRRTSPGTAGSVLFWTIGGTRVAMFGVDGPPAKAARFVLDAVDEVAKGTLPADVAAARAETLSARLPDQRLSGITGWIDYGLVLGHAPSAWSQLVDQARRVTDADVKRIASTHLKKERARVFGFGAALESLRGLQALGLGPVTAVEDQGERAPEGAPR